MEKKFIVFIVAAVAILFLGNYISVNSNKNNKKSQETPVTQVTSSQTETAVSNENRPEAQSLSKTPPLNKIIESNKIRLSALNLGGMIDSIVIKGFDNEGKQVDLVQDPKTSQAFRVSLNSDLKSLPLDAPWSISVRENTVQYESTSTSEIKVKKEIELTPNDYDGKIKLEITNQGQEKVNIDHIFIHWGPFHKTDKENVLETVVYHDGKKDTFGPKKSYNLTSVSLDKGWVGVRTHYFCSIFYAQPGVITSVDVYQNADQSLGVSLHLPDAELLPAQTKSYELNAYWGPQNYQGLKAKGFNLNKIVSFGMFHSIGVIMLYILKFFYSLTGNYGFSIILLTLLIRAILWWPTQKSYTSMKSMQSAMNKMQPRLKTIKEVYRDNPQKLNEETMKLYKEYKVNPMGGCLPMLLQMPIFFALYATLSGSVELKGAGFLWVWKDLSMKDPIYLLPIAMGLTTFLQQKISNAPAATPEAAAQQKMMLYFMPIMLTFFSFMWPSGLLLYWVVSNAISISQQAIINRSS